MPPAKNSFQPQLFLIDGNSLVYRAFFALPDSIATSDGRPTNAIFGFSSMLVKLISDYGVVPTVVVWDAGSSGRKEVYPEYKAQRASRPDLLKDQWPAFEPLVEALGYTNIAVEGYEADDVIASLAKAAKAQGISTTIVTGDRDALQLVDDDAVKVLATSRGITETKLYDRQAVIDRYGIAPELIPDFYGLKGDTSDNIPGVPGVGDKTASALLQQFGDLEGVLANIDQISGAKRKQNLTEHSDDARISKQLATSQQDIPVEIDFHAVLKHAPDRSALRDFFREYELRDPLRRLEEALAESDAEALPAPAAVDETVVRVRRIGLSDVSAWVGRQSGSVVAAVEAPQTNEGELLPKSLLWQFAVCSNENPTEVWRGEIEKPGELVQALGEARVVTHEAKLLDDIPPNLVFDTELAAYLLDPARRGYPLEELAEERGIVVRCNDDDLIGKRAAQIALLAAQQEPQLRELALDRVLSEIELPGVCVLRAMEKIGVKLDTAQLAVVAKRIREQAAELEREIWELAGTEFTIGSPQQLAEILFVKLGLSRKRRGKTGFSTDARVLQSIRDEHPIVAKIERYRELSKLVQTYLDALPHWIDPSDGRLHTTFLQTNTTTGRLASINPNLQNIPIRTETGREIRSCFTAEPGNLLLSIDYSQVELRILAHIADEPILKEIFRRGGDVHSETAAAVFGVDPSDLTVAMRSKAKMINYGIVYGLSAFGMADRLSISEEEAQEFIDRYFERFARVRQLISDATTQAIQHGYVSTLFGRRREIPEIQSPQWATRKLGERLAVNMVIQGTAADIIKLAMIRCHTALADSGYQTRLVLQIHDELLFEGPEGEMEAVTQLLAHEMIAACELDPPLAVDCGVGPNWLAAK